MSEHSSDDEEQVTHPRPVPVRTMITKRNASEDDEDEEEDEEDEDPDEDDAASSKQDEDEEEDDEDDELDDEKNGNDASRFTPAATAKPPPAAASNPAPAPAPKKGKPNAAASKDKQQTIEKALFSKKTKAKAPVASDDDDDDGAHDSDEGAVSTTLVTQRRATEHSLVADELSARTNAAMQGSASESVKDMEAQAADCVVNKTALAARVPVIRDHGNGNVPYCLIPIDDCVHAKNVGAIEPKPIPIDVYEGKQTVRTKFVETLVEEDLDYVLKTTQFYKCSSTKGPARTVAALIPVQYDDLNNPRVLVIGDNQPYQLMLPVPVTIMKKIYEQFADRTRGEFPPSLKPNDKTTKYVLLSASKTNDVAYTKIDFVPQKTGKKKRKKATTEGADAPEPKKRKKAENSSRASKKAKANADNDAMEDDAERTEATEEADAPDVADAAETTETNESVQAATPMQTVETATSSEEAKADGPTSDDLLQKLAKKKRIEMGLTGMATKALTVMNYSMVGNKLTIEMPSDYTSAAIYGVFMR